LLACSGAPYRMYVPRPTRKYKVDPLTIPDNITIETDRGVIVEANAGFGASAKLFDFDGASNVTMICNGATFQMLKAEYTTGESRHCFNLINCTNVSIYESNAKDSGGDGYYINGATNLLLHNPIGDNNRRQGVSIIKADGLRGTGIWWMKNTTGTAPGDGVDIEPNSDADDLKNINIDCILSENNDGNALSIYLDDYKTGAPEDVSITIGKVISRGNTQAVRARNCYLNSGSYGGHIAIGEVVTDGDSSNAVFVEDKSVSGPLLTIGKVTSVNPCTGASTFANTSAVYLSDTSATICGGIHIGPVSVKATHSDMDYGVILETGGGFTDVRIELENVRGYQVAPVRYNNITATIAEASTCIVDVSKILDTVAITTGTNIVATAHYGRIVTNAGASGSVTAALREYLPQGNPYRFRVEAAQTLAIDTFDAADRIVGTTGVGQTVTSNVVGAECVVYYLGTFSAVKYWKLDPIGNPADWTFN